MLDYLKRHHVGIIALFIALGGTSYAATQLSSNSVGTKQIRDGAVTPAKLSPAVGTLLRRKGTEAHRPRPGPGAGAQAPWRAPTILAKIKSAGQRAISQKIVTVAANAPWVDTGLSVAAGEHLWTDTRSDGKWSGNPRFFPYSDANGLSVYPGGYRVDAKAAVLSLIGFLGSSPPTPREESIGVSVPAGGGGGVTNPGFVEIGNTLLDFAPTNPGELWLRNNDNTNSISDVGKQIVKVLITTG